MCNAKAHVQAWRQELQEVRAKVDKDIAIQETQVLRMRELIKEDSQRQRKSPASKRNKLDGDTYEVRQEDEMHTKQRQEKRKMDESPEANPTDKK